MMPEPADPWHHQRRPGPSGAAGSLATTTAAHPGDHIELPVLPVAVGWARRRGGEILREWELDADTVETVSLLISELVTNALLHGVPEAATADTPPRCARCAGQVCVNLKQEPGAVVIEVFDSGISPPRRTVASLDGTAFDGAAFDDTVLGTSVFDTDAFDDTASEGGECGRGLMIVANLSEEQGYYLPSAGGKIVWCVVKAGS